MPLVTNMEITKEYYQSPFGVNNQLFFCGVPLRLDSYSGCSHLCKYCFARANREFNSATMDNRGAPAAVLAAKPTDFIRTLRSAHSSEERNNTSVDFLRHHVPIHWGGMSDPFQHCEEKYGVTYKWMQVLNEYQYPVVISTKGVRILQESKYIELLKKGKYAVQISLISGDDNIMHAIEPGAPNATERINAIKNLSDMGVWVAVRIQPLIAGSPIEYNLASFINTLAQAGAKHILVEKFKPSANNPQTEEIWKMFPDTIAQYKYPDVKNCSHEKILPAWRQYKYIKVAKQACHEAGVTFGAADNEMRDHGDVICCCGIDNVPGFENYWKYQASSAAIIAKEKGSVTLSDMQEFWDGGENSIDEQEGPLREYSKLLKCKVTPKFAVDYFWGFGGDNSPEGMYSMKRSQINGQTAYIYKDRTTELEYEQKEQGVMF